MIYRYIHIFIIILFLPFSAKAELLLLEKKGNTYEAVDYEASQNKTEIETVFEKILLMYQWPMVTVHFYKFPQEEQHKYLEYLESENGIEEFVNDKIMETYGDKYKVIFVPGTIFELGVLNSFAEGVLNSTVIPSGPDENSQSIFPQGDLRNAYYVFTKLKLDLAERIMDGLNKFAHTDNAPIKAAEYAYEGYNLNPAVKESYFQTLKYLWIHYKDQIESLRRFEENDKSVDYLVRTLSERFMKNYPDFFAKLKGVEKSPGGIFKGFLKPEDIDILKTGTLGELKASKNNDFLLFRGSGGFDLSKGAEERGPQTLIDTPAREILEDYKKITQETSPSIKNILPIRPTEDPVSPAPEGTFTPMTLSYGNSLLAGTFYDCEEGDQGARALDYSRKKLGYALFFPMKEYLVPTGTNISLFKKYFISPLHSVAGLMFGGEFFHSRSKMSLVMPDKEWSGDYKGMVVGYHEKIILQQDRGARIGFLITPDVDWRQLSSDITHDIGKNIIWLKTMNPIDREILLDTQMKAGDFSGMELDAFKEHFIKFQPVLGQLKEASPSLKGQRIYYKGRANKSDSAQYPLDMRNYEPDNVFWKILQNPDSNLATAKRYETEHSLVFDDLRKRTKEHSLVLPKGKYISFSHFIDKASPEEIMDFFRTVAGAAEKTGVDQKGYRIVSNNALIPNQPANNDANQEIPHFHVHLAGGECLGKPVAGVKNAQNSNESVEMDVSTPPYGFGLSTEQFLKNVFTNKISDMTFMDPKKGQRKLVAYRIPSRQLNVPEYIGFVLLDDKGKSVYKSIQDFFKTASQEELVNTFNFINTMAKKTGIYDSGFRLIADHGKDAWHFPSDIMQITIAGGNKLGVTVTNAWGNRRKGPGGGSWEQGKIYDYEQLIDMPHQHCPANSGDYVTFIENLEDKAGIDAKNKEFYESCKKITENFDSLNPYDKEDGYYNIFNYKDDKVYETVFLLYLVSPGGDFSLEKNTPAILKLRDEEYAFIADSKEGMVQIPMPEQWKQWLEPDVLFKTYGTQGKIMLHESDKADSSLLSYLRQHKAYLKTEQAVVNPGAIPYEFFKNMKKTYEGYKQINEQLKVALKGIEPFIHNVTKDVSEARSVENKLKGVSGYADVRDYIDFLRFYKEKMFEKKSFHTWGDDKSFWELTSYHSSYKWIFIDLDAVYQTIDPYNSSEIESIFKSLIESGFKVIGITNSLDDRYIVDWLKSFGFEVSNPENLQPFNLNGGDEYLTNQPSFKDGIIFCGNDPAGKGWCLQKYLDKLAQKQGEFPGAIYYYDNDPENLEAILETLGRFEIPGIGYLYKEIDYNW